MASHTRLPDIRSRLAATQMAAKEARESLAYVKAQAETRAIQAAGGEKALGGNAESRERALLLALGADEAYQAQLKAVRALEDAAANLEAELEGEKDLRREREWGVRLRLAEALDRRGVQSDGDPPQGDRDESFENAVDALAYGVTVCELRDMASEKEPAMAAAASPRGQLAADDLPF